MDYENGYITVKLWYLY